MSAGPDGNFLQLPIGKKSDPAAVGETNNGSWALSVPASGRAVTCAMERSQITGSAPGAFAINAMARPSGDRAN